MPSRVLTLARELDVTSRAVVATDVRGVIVYWSRGAEMMFGWAADEVMGRAIMDVTVAASSAERARELMDTLRQGDPWSGDFLVQHRDGRRFSARVTDIPVLDDDGALLGIVGISRPTGQPLV